MGEDGIYLDAEGLAGVVADLRSEAAVLDGVVVVGDGGDMGYNMDTAASDLGTDAAFSLTNLSSLVTALATALESAGVSTVETDNNMVRHTGGAVPV